MIATKTEAVRICLCGCGKFTPIAPETRPRRGWVKGAPMPYYPHHSKNLWAVSDGFTKQCRDCKAVQPIENFSINRKTRDGRQRKRRECASQTMRIYADTPTGRLRKKIGQERGSYASYGITRSEFEALLLAQDGCCAICHRPETARHRGTIRRLAIDHNHITGEIRGLLCMDCNHGIGKLSDNPALLRAAAEYIERGLPLR